MRCEISTFPSLRPELRTRSCCALRHLTIWPTTKETPTKLSPEFPIYYVFYEILTSPATLQRIVDLPEDPKMGKAKLVGYALEQWGDYPALIDGEQDQEVPGYAYFVQSEEEAQKFAYYETNTYEEAHGLIYFVVNKEPAEAPGKTFVYAGNANALLEQRFDCKLWMHHMAGKLHISS